MNSQRHYNHRSGGKYEDRLICTFYNKIGACRHGEKCSRKHVKPMSSHTVLLSNLYENPKLNKNNDELVPKQVQQHFDQFYKDVFIKLTDIGEVKAMIVCENENDHLNGNVYVRFKEKDSAYNAMVILNQEWFNGRPVHCELSPVGSFAEANCRAYELETCNRGDHCNFMHTRQPTKSVKESLLSSQEKSLILKKLNELSQDTPEEEPVVEEKVAEPEKVTTSMVQQLFA